VEDCIDGSRVWKMKQHILSACILILNKIFKEFRIRRQSPEDGRAYTQDLLSHPKRDFIRV
jgi:hypothetical protein